MAMTLYSAPLSPFAARNRIQVRAKGLMSQISIAPLPDWDAYRRISPTGKVPALETREDLVLVESDAIAEYIEDCFPSPSLRGATPDSTARGRILIRLLDLYFFAGVSILIFQHRSGAPQASRVEEGLARLDEGLRWIEFYLPDGPYAVDGRLTLADCALATGLFFTFVSTPFGQPAFLGRRRLQRYYERVNAADPHCAAVHQEMAEEQARREQLARVSTEAPARPSISS